MPGLTPPHNKVRVGDINIAYRWDGRPRDDSDSPLLMMAHSLGSNHRLWDWQLPALTDRFRILRYDWRGHGATDAPAGAYTLGQFETDAVGLMDALGIERVHWVGISTGAMIGQGLGINHSDRIASLSLCNTMSLASDWYKSFADEREVIVNESGLEPVWDMTHKLWFTDAFADAANASYQAVRNMLLQTSTQGYLGSVRAVTGLAYRADLHRITAPTLVLAAGDDPVTSPAQAKEIADAVDDARYVVLDGLRHYSNVEAPDRFNRALTEFLDVATHS